MKKLLIIVVTLLSLLAITQVSYSQETKLNSYDKTVEKISNGTEIVYNDLKSTAPKITEALSSLGKELKVSSTKVWNILVKQQLVFSISILICILTTFLSWIHFWYRIKRYQIMESTTNHGSDYVISCVITVSIAIFGSVISVMHFVDMITGFINPEYGAIKTIVEVASKIK